jgi:hypothetical protein
MWDAWRIREMHAKFWWEKDEKRHRIEHLFVIRRTVLKQRLKKYHGRKSSGFLWLRVETSGQR